MGMHPSIGKDRFPRQGAVGERMKVRLSDGSELGGTMRRDDMEAPWLTLIELDDGRFVLGTECVYAFEKTPTELRTVD